MPAAILIRTRCTRCGETKSPDDFGRCSYAVSGRRSVCKVCAKELARAYGQTPAGRAVRERAKAKYRASEHGKAHEYAFHKAYRQTPSGRAAFARAEKKRDPLKVAARKAVYRAVRDGRLVRQPCECCGAFPSEGHHEDYSKPLVVRWLCTPCHDREHAGGAHAV